MRTFIAIVTIGLLSTIVLIDLLGVAICGITAAVTGEEAGLILALVYGFCAIFFSVITAGVLYLAIKPRIVERIIEVPRPFLNNIRNRLPLIGSRN